MLMRAIQLAVEPEDADKSCVSEGEGLVDPTLIMNSNGFRRGTGKPPNTPRRSFPAAMSGQGWLWSLRGPKRPCDPGVTRAKLQVEWVSGTIR